jgi:hypothetical protein
MEMFKDAVSWVEIPVSDFSRAKEFYSKIYDYAMPEMKIGASTMGILPYDQTSGGIGAAIVKGDGYVPSSAGAKVYLNGGSDLSIVLKRVEVAGGKIVLRKTEIAPSLGFLATFVDTEGNHISLHSSK